MSPHCSIVLISPFLHDYLPFHLTFDLALRLVLGNLATWTHGACIVYASDIYDPKLIVDAVSEERCTALHGVPTHFLGVLAEVERRRVEGEALDFSRLRYVSDRIPFNSLV